jgi:hypothetical protein
LLVRFHPPRLLWPPRFPWNLITKNQLRRIRTRPFPVFSPGLESLSSILMKTFN